MCVCCVCVYRCDSEKRVYSETKNNNNNKTHKKILSSLFLLKKIVYNNYTWKMENGVMRSCGRQIEKENCFFFVLNDDVVDATACIDGWTVAGFLCSFFLQCSDVVIHFQLDVTTICW